ncbi:cortactin-binding protein 2-like [Mytilus trossulus]|uniref:cortactin-binding protein 2-like n=1 Tax=Mytilus trossulus TaxID=6551 RepID=UPI003006E8BC
MAVQNEKCSSPLYTASERGHSAVAKYSLESNADISQCNKYKISPLCVACKEGHKDIVKLLLENNVMCGNNADVNKCEDEYGKSPLYVACKRGHKDIVELLLQNNADGSQCDKDGWSLSHAACKEGHTYTI